MIPAPRGRVVTYAYDGGAVWGDRRLSRGRGHWSLGVDEDGAARVGGARDGRVPDVGAAHLVTQRQNPLPEAHEEPHEPDVAVLVVENVDDGDAGVRVADSQLGEPAGDVIASGTHVDVFVGVRV